MGPEERAKAMIGVSAAYLAVAWITFSLRTVVKSYIMRSFALDDWLMIMAMLAFTVEGGFLITMGQDLKDVEVTTIHMTYQVFQLAFYTLANVLLKASLATTFNRILLGKWQRITIQSCIGIHTTFSLATMFLTIFRCGTNLGFNTQHQDSTCVVDWTTMQGILYTNSIINTTVSWTLTLLPILSLHAMELNHQAKLSVCFILVLGCLSSIASIPRFGLIHTLDGTGPHFRSNANTMAVLGVAENGTGVIAACLLTLRPLLRGWRAGGHGKRDSSDLILNDEEMQEVEFGQAKAVSLYSVSATSVAGSSGGDSVFRVKYLDSEIVVGKASMMVTDPSLLLRRRSSCKPLAGEEMTLDENVFCVDDTVTE